MRISKKIVSSTITASILISFTACGGGSSSPTTKINGTAVDGYISGATVCLDLNLDNVCQSSSEPTSTTTSEGKFSLNITNTHKSHTHYAAAPILVYGGTDITTSLNFVGLMKVQNSSTSLIVSPLTTMVKAIINSGKTEDEAKTAVATLFSLSIEDIMKDPIAEYANNNTGILNATVLLQETIKKAVESESDKINEFESIYSKFANTIVSNEGIVSLESVVSTTESVNINMSEVTQAKDEILQSLENEVEDSA